MATPTAENLIADLRDHLTELKAITDVSSAYLDGVTDGMVSSDNVTGIVAALIAKTRSLTKTIQAQADFLELTLGFLGTIALRTDDLREREANLTSLIGQIVEILGDRLPPKAIPQGGE